MTQRRRWLSQLQREDLAVGPQGQGSANPNAAAAVEDRWSSDSRHSRARQRGYGSAQGRAKLSGSSADNGEEQVWSPTEKVAGLQTCDKVWPLTEKAAGQPPSFNGLIVEDVRNWQATKTWGGNGRTRALRRRRGTARMNWQRTRTNKVQMRHNHR